MQSTAKNVDAYLVEVVEERGPALAQLRSLCRSILTDFEESMVYGMPSYARNGEVEVAFASQKRYISVYFLRTDVMKAYKEQLVGRGVSFGKGCIRYSQPMHINFDVIGQMLEVTQASTGVVC